MPLGPVLPALGSGAASVSALVLAHVRARPVRVAILTVLSLVLAASAVLPSIVVARVVDTAIGGRLDLRAAVIAATAILALAIWDAALTLARRHLAVATEMRLRDAEATRHFRASLRLPLRAYAGGNEAALIRSFDDLDRIVEFLAARSVELFAETAIAVSSATLMLWVEWRLALVFVILSGLSLLTSTRLNLSARLALDAWLPVRDRRFAFIVECLTAMPTIKTLSAHSHVLAPFQAEQSLEQDRLRAWRHRQAQADSVVRFWSVATPGIGTVCGAAMLIGGAISAGDLLLFVSVSAGLGAALAGLQSHLREWHEARAGLERMRALGMGRPEPLADAPGSEPPAPRAIHADTISFRHPGALRDTLDAVTLHAAAGEHIAIVGRSGEGKTTLAHILTRLLGPDRGTLTLGGTPPLPLDRHRRAVLLVPHAVTVFNATTRENVRLWDTAIDDAAIWKALDLAALRTQVEGWDAGLDAPLGANGNPLSAGQQQRLGLARAFVRRPDVLILDEATSAMDTQTEAEVLRNIRAFMHGRALIAITHRDAVAATFDRVVRIESGRAVSDPQPHHSP